MLPSPPLLNSDTYPDASGLGSCVDLGGDTLGKLFQPRFPGRCLSSAMNDSPGKRLERNRYTEPKKHERLQSRPGASG